MKVLVYRGRALRLAEASETEALAASGWSPLASAPAEQMEYFQQLHGNREPYASAMKAPKRPSSAVPATAKK